MSGGDRSDDEDDFDGENANPALPFRMTLQEPHGGVSGGSSGQNTPPPPPRGGRAPSGSPDVISASLLGSRQQSPKSGTDSPLLRAPPRGGGRGAASSKLAEPSQGLSGLVGYRGDDDEDDEDEDGSESKAHRRRSAEDAEDEGSQGLVPDYMDISTASFMFDKTLSSQNADASAGFATSLAVPVAGGGGGSNSGNSVVDGVVQIPPEPPGRCSKQLQENIAEKYERYLRDGIDYNRAIQRKKDFKNPSIYEKLIEISGISEFGTNYSRDIYDPLLWGPESNYEELAKAQKVEMDKREEKRKGGDVRTSKVEFVSGTAKKTASASNTNVVGTCLETASW